MKRILIAAVAGLFAAVSAQAARARITAAVSVCPGPRPIRGGDSGGAGTDYYDVEVHDMRLWASVAARDYPHAYSTL